MKGQLTACEASGLAPQLLPGQELLWPAEPLRVAWPRLEGSVRRAARSFHPARGSRGVAPL